MQDIVGRAWAHDAISMHLSASDRDGMLTFKQWWDGVIEHVQ